MKFSQEKFDISVILNCHDEDTYVKPTFESLSIASDVARKAGLSVQIIVILDNAANSLIEIIEGFDYKSFDDKKIFEVSNRSLGLSRNTGIEHSAGEFIYVTDADDLISSNSILASYLEATSFYEENKTHAIFIPEYLLSFGTKKCFTTYYPSKYFSPCDYIAFHPFCSRIFAHNSLFKNRNYKNLNNSSGFAFEDWELNTEFLIDGFSIVPVKDTILFYRQRQGSIMASNNYVKEPKLEKLSRLGNFLNVFDKFSYPDDLLKKKSEDSFSLFFKSPKLCKYLDEANRLDPSVNLSSERSSYDAVWKNLDIVQFHLGNIFPILLHLVGLAEYDDIILLPWLKAGGGEKYILQIVSSILTSSPNRKALVITLEYTKSNDWITKLPENCTFLNFENIVRNLNEKDRFRLLLRLLLTISKPGKTNIHIKSGVFVNKFLNEFGVSLSKSLKIYKYLFCLETKKNKDSVVIDPKQVQEIRKSIDYTYKFISDNKKIADFFIGLLGDFYRDRFLKIYAYIPLNTKDQRETRNNHKLKLIWASRICDQKRFEVLYKISELLATKLPDLIIDVYGSLDNNYQIKTRNNLVYKGEFGTLNDIDLSRYIGFLYTSWYDGLPNIILEMLSKRLPVIAPISKFSGIDEILTIQTGWPVIHSNNDNEMAKRYVERIMELLESSEEADARAKRALKLLELQHVYNKQLIQVKKEFVTEELNSCPLIKDQWKSINRIIFLTYEAVGKIKTLRTVNWKKIYARDATEVSSSVLRQKILQFEKECEIPVSTKERLKTFLSKNQEIYKFAKKIYSCPKIKVVIDRLIS